MRKDQVPQPQRKPEIEEVANRQAARLKRQLGFTLIEMLAVVLILAIVAGVGFVVVNNQIEKARVNTDIANLRTLADAVNRYTMDNGKPPTTINDLVGKYLGAVPSSPWSADVAANNVYSITVTQPSGNNPGVITILSPHSYDSAPAGSSSSGNTGLLYDGTNKQLKLVLNY